MSDDEFVPPDELRIRELLRLARGTFETPGEANDWLKRPHPSLEGATPLECAKSKDGIQRIKDILNAIKYGGVA